MCCTFGSVSQAPANPSLHGSIRGHGHYWQSACPSHVGASRLPDGGTPSSARASLSTETRDGTACAIRRTFCLLPHDSTERASSKHHVPSDPSARLGSGKARARAGGTRLAGPDFRFRSPAPWRRLDLRANAPTSSHGPSLHSPCPDGRSCCRGGRTPCLPECLRCCRRG